MEWRKRRTFRFLAQTHELPSDTRKGKWQQQVLGEKTVEGVRNGTGVSLCAGKYLSTSLYLYFCVYSHFTCIRTELNGVIPVFQIPGLGAQRESQRWCSHCQTTKTVLFGYYPVPSWFECTKFEMPVEFPNEKGGKGLYGCGAHKVILV